MGEHYKVTMNVRCYKSVPVLRMTLDFTRTSVMVLAAWYPDGTTLWSYHECAMLQVCNSPVMALDFAMTLNSNKQIMFWAVDEFGVCVCVVVCVLCVVCGCICLCEFAQVRKHHHLWDCYPRLTCQRVEVGQAQLTTVYRLLVALVAPITMLTLMTGITLGRHTWEYHCKYTHVVTW